MTATKQAGVTSSAGASFSVQEGAATSNLSATLIADAGISGAAGPLTITAVDGSASSGFVDFNTATDAVYYTASGYDPYDTTDSFGYTVSDGTTSWAETATVAVTTTQPNLSTVVADPTDTHVDASGYGQRIILSNAATCSVTGAQGNDLVFAGSGADTISLSGYSNTIYGGSGGDTIDAGNGSDTVFARDGNNWIVAPGYNNTIFAGNGNDVVLAPQGNSAVTLGNGNQTVVLFGYDNTVSIGDGGATPGLIGKSSYINAGDGGATITAGNGTNIVLAGGYGDTITVGNGTNLIFATNKSGGLDAPSNLPNGYTGTQGSLGNCSVTLGNGNDWVYLHGYGNTVEAGAGTDALWGGAGGDDFVLNAKGGALFIENFSLSNGDKLDLSQILAGTSLRSDLTNLASFVKVIGHATDDAAFGTKSDGGINTQLAITGVNATALVTLENTGSVTLSNLVADKSLTFGQ